MEDYYNSPIIIRRQSNNGASLVGSILSMRAATDLETAMTAEASAAIPSIVNVANAVGKAARDAKTAALLNLVTNGDSGGSGLLMAAVLGAF